MDVSFVSGFSALGGSMVGGLISGIATYLAQWSQVRAGYRAHQIAHREDLFRDFIVAASKSYGQALMSDQPNLQDLVTIYGMVNRMEILCLPPTIACAKRVVEATLDAYFEPNKTFSDLRAMLKSGDSIDPLSEFAAAAREELNRLAGQPDHRTRSRGQTDDT